jgi:hypothetical protein
MTTARITSLSPQVYSSTARAPANQKLTASAPKTPHAEAGAAQPAAGAAPTRQGGTPKMPGVGDVVDVLT